MIKYNLLCKCGKNFESWFSTSKEYESLKKKKLINCIYCNSTSIKKSIMSPNLTSKSNKKTAKNGGAKKGQIGDPKQLTKDKIAQIIKQIQVSLQLC